MHWHIDPEKEKKLIAKVRDEVINDRNVDKNHEFSRKIRAILHHRIMTGSDLRQAKEWVESNPEVYAPF